MKNLKILAIVCGLSLPMISPSAHAAYWFVCKSQDNACEYRCAIKGHKMACNLSRGASSCERNIYCTGLQPIPDVKLGYIAISPGIRDMFCRRYGTMQERKNSDPIKEAYDRLFPNSR